MYRSPWLTELSARYVSMDGQAFVDAWTAACGSEEEAVVAVPAAKAYQIWPVQLSGPCKKKLKLLVRALSPANSFSRAFLN